MLPVHTLRFSPPFTRFGWSAAKHYVNSQRLTPPCKPIPNETADAVQGKTGTGVRQVGTDR
jgi:hypothetical protein